MKKVLIISPQPFFQWRGSPIRVGFDALALSELGWRVDLLVLPVGEEGEAVPGVRVFRVPNVFRVGTVPIGPSFIKLCFDVLLLVKGLRLALRNGYDVIHGIEDGGFIAVIIARLAGSRAVFERHSDPSSYRKGPLRNLLMRIYGAVERFTARHATAVIATGPGLAAQVREMDGAGTVYDIGDIPSSLVESSPAGTAGIRKRLAPLDGQTLALFVGSFAVYQGVDLMLDAMPAAVAACPGLRFAVIGGSADQIEAKRARLAKAGLSSCLADETGADVESPVMFLGLVPPGELPDYLSAADILLSPRLGGVNTPLKLLDYLKAGRAVVATDTEGNRLILDDSTALIVPPDPDSFAGGITRLAGDPDLRAKLAATGRVLIDETYNFDEFKRKLGECYAGLVEG